MLDYLTYNVGILLSSCSTYVNHLICSDIVFLVIHVNIYLHSCAKIYTAESTRQLCESSVINILISHIYINKATVKLTNLI
jgi:hypothetical protein